MTQSIAIIDYGCGNLASVQKAVTALGFTAEMISDPSTLDRYGRAILPGVGSFNAAMNDMTHTGLADSIREFCGSGKPLLGICLGMQLLASSGTEGVTHDSVPGLDLVPGEVVSLRSMGVTLSVPHVGWNTLQQKQPSELFGGVPDGTDVYFVHSYGFCPDKSDHLMGATEHGVEISAIVKKDNVTGCQFHPEKSSKIGYRILQNWVSLC
ncbi:MAG: imidazole glycerol phosphate synthase subunit HisH [Gammaproteobacteria bacterium]|nr:imidazole glycerol phosphate synthase subunit HisH [Gammaproteobacteria bacterium]